LSMAGVVISGVIGDVVARAISLLAGQLQDRRGVQDKLRQLRHLVIRLESAVEAAEERRITSRALLAWLSELVDAVYQGRYFLDASQGEDALEITDDGRGLLRSLFLPSSFNPSKRLRVAARRLMARGGGGGALPNLQRASGGLAEFIMLLQGCPPAPYRPLTTNIDAESQMFGRHVEMRRVLDFLLHDDDELGVLPIIGRAGMGKTTLMQHVCDEPAVRRRFSLITLLDFHCMSLTAAGSETARLLRSLFTVAGEASTGLAGGGDTLRLLERELRGRGGGFLAVFDNVDRRRKLVIDAIMPALRRGRRGSRVIVAGNDTHVADLATAEPVVLRPLGVLVLLQGARVRRRGRPSPKGRAARSSAPRSWARC
jgi:hypothetical protein